MRAKRTPARDLRRRLLDEALRRQVHADWLSHLAAYRPADVHRPTLCIVAHARRICAMESRGRAAILAMQLWRDGVGLRRDRRTASPNVGIVGFVGPHRGFRCDGRVYFEMSGPRGRDNIASFDRSLSDMAARRTRDHDAAAPSERRHVQSAEINPRLASARTGRIHHSASALAWVSTYAPTGGASAWAMSPGRARRPTTSG
jgi:hypothetical protein